MKQEITVRDILKDPRFKDFKVLAGEEGLDRTVEAITVMDAPDPFLWRTGHEIVLSSGYVFVVNEGLFYKSVEEFNKTGISALFIKMERFVKVLPKDVKELADKLKFPIVDVPIQLAHIEVINPTLTTIIDHQAKALMRSERIHTELSNIVINNGELQTIIDVLSNILEVPLCYYDAHFQTTYYSKTGSRFIDELEKNTIEEVTNKYSFYKIGVKSDTYGYLLFLTDENFQIDSEAKVVLTHANTAIILDAQKKISSMQIEQRHKNEFVQDLIMNNIKYRNEVLNRAALFHWQLENIPLCVMVVDIDDYKEQFIHAVNQETATSLEEERKNIMTLCLNYMKLHFTNLIYTKFSDSIVFLLKEPEGFTTNKEFEKLLKRTGDTLREEIKDKTKFTITAAIGSFQNDVMDIHKSYEEARQSIEISRLMGSGRDATLQYEQLGFYEFLYRMHSSNESTHFYEEMLEPILNYDEEHKVDMMTTLVVIINHDWNLKESAKALYIHYNTIKYRYKIISEVVNLNLSEYKSRLKLTLAVSLYQMSRITS
ncbi:MAG: PucR family transcriptional regulator ligand-binding domain-containing protein [Lachnospiraceae bacterium]|jgi:purine catabolism regulator|nr:PucR family transcriptional regulator ligand-binding domain-containing protein [Lachnospiraceae bacterium]